MGLMLHKMVHNKVCLRHNLSLNCKKYLHPDKNVVFLIVKTENRKTKHPFYFTLFYSLQQKKNESNTKQNKTKQNKIKIK